MNMQPLISIIIPVYNSEKFILKTLQSIIDQNYPNWEAICIDDCSSDESVILIEKLMKKDERIKLIKNELNYGPAKSRNIGLHYSKGEYITFLDSDDFWNKNKLKLQYEFMIKKDIDFSFTAYDLVNLKGESLHTVIDVPEKINYTGLLGRTVISTITVMVSKKLKTYLYMPENYSNGEDMATWLNVLKHTEYAYGLNIVLSSYRQVDGSLSSGLFNKLTRMWKVYRKIEKLSLYKSCQYYIKYIFNVIKKRKKSYK